MVYVTTGTVVEKKDSTTNKTPTVTGAANSPTLGNGGINYASANVPGRQSIVNNQAQIKNDDAYRQSEIARTLATITNRQNQGLDISAQTKYLNTNLGYQAPMSQAASNVQAAPAAQNNFAIPGSRTEATLGRIDDFINKQSGFQFTKPDAFSYDQTTDPAYQAQLAEAKRNVATQQADTNAGLRATGQGKSSWSETVANQIGTGAMESIANNLVPALMQQAYQRYSDDANRDLQVQQMNYGVGQDAIGNLGNLYGLQNQEYFQNPLQEAQVTGNYLPTAAKDAINNLLSLKQQAETKGITAEDRSALSKQADFIRNQLTSMGIDASQYGANVSSSNAAKVNPGIRTLAGQQMDLGNKQANLAAAGMYMDASGKLITPQSDWGGLVRQATNPNGQLTLAGQNQAFNQGQQQWQNNFAVEQFAYQKARDAVGDSQWAAQFEQNATQFGLNYALQQLQQQDDSAYRNAMLGISQDENSRAWLSLGNTKPAEYSGMTPGQVLSALQSQYIDPATEKYAPPKDTATKEQIYMQVTGFGLPQGQDDQVLLSMGLTQKDIQDFDKKYGVTSGN
ncbi:hypothetical protein QP794_27225 [Paenibacillus sp. UMB7766-LJ446]|uniref:hypothetical protein n=1 Tax=Paenibacillus sp. UMB7766-LJ446 TaxID=3046313 RepID=UPI00254C7EDA|nr:hypothetical protein [Paenibacillus sp. UMB7766-LJ446]MDK8193779.1 hypothetical protein [Paenibacillus sp. UMB7766-LJ446]